LLVVSVLIVAFFSSAEASLISVNKFRIRHLAERGSKPAQAANRVVRKHEKFFATILFTENAFIILASSVGTAMAFSIFGDSGITVLLTSLVLTVFIVVFGEITPKSLAAQAAERWSLIVARPIEIIMTLETYFIYLFTLLPKGVLMLMGGKKVVETPSITEGELRMLIGISQAEGMVEEQEAQMLEKVFRFGDRQLREVMTPRTEVVWVKAGTTLKEFLAIYLGHSHTRFPVFEDHVENVMGVLSVKDVMAAIASGEVSDDTPVTYLLRSVDFVPDTKPVGALFREMQKAGSQIALAVDEFGGIAGLVTLKQLMEEVVGPAGEEGMQPEVEYETIDENTFHIDGGMQIEQANEELGLDLPKGDYETVAGFILEVLGHIPNPGEHFRHNGLRLEVTQLRGMRIEKVMVTRGLLTPGG
jgi:CBS domain containing-hemolysin-like protein